MYRAGLLHIAVLLWELRCIEMSSFIYHTSVTRTAAELAGDMTESQTCNETRTHSNIKNNPLVTRIRPSVRGSTPLCRATMIRPSQ